jgi:N-acyl-D-amino-acid deacylase
MKALLVITSLATLVVAGAIAEEPLRDQRVAAPERVEPLTVSQDAAIQRSLALLESSATTYTEKRECFSCHHQTLPAVTLALGTDRGYTVDAKRMAAQADFTLKYFGARADRLKKGDGVPGGPFTAGYALIGLKAAGRDADETTAALIAYLFKTQEKNGQWRIRTHRPPLEDSHFSATALAVRGIQLYATKDQAEEVGRRVHEAQVWLVASLEAADDAKPESGKEPKPKQQATKLTNEDRTFRLLGLTWSGADKATIKRAADDLLAQQRGDGGWAQTADMTSDAYATGQALVALHEAGGLATDDAVYRRGAEHLRGTRLADGSWLVTTRSKAIQTYFESGFPHAKSQFISICGTCWATQALLLQERAK